MVVFASGFAPQNISDCKLWRECPLGYELLYDEELNKKICFLVDQTVGFETSILNGGDADYLSYKIATPFLSILDCINSIGLDGDTDRDLASKGSGSMSYYPDYCFEPYYQAYRACLFAIGRKG